MQQVCSIARFNCFLVQSRQVFLFAPRWPGGPSAGAAGAGDHGGMAMLRILLPPHLVWAGLDQGKILLFFGEICLLTFVYLIAVPSDEVALAEERAQVHGRLHPHVIISMKASNKRERKRKIKFGAEILLRYTHTYIVRTYVGRKRQKIGLFPKKQSGRKNKENGGKTYMLQQEFRKT